MSAKRWSPMLRMALVIGFGMAVWPLTLVTNAFRRLRGLERRSAYEPVLGGVYARLLNWAASPSREIREQIAALARSDPDRYSVVGLPSVGPALLDKTKTARWTDSMCFHCVHGDAFPDCPNDYSSGFTKESGPMMCGWFEPA